ncbi:hypothetical protein BKA93DRAFT_424474 [Sparassis latifolia]
MKGVAHLPSSSSVSIASPLVPFHSCSAGNDFLTCATVSYRYVATVKSFFRKRESGCSGAAQIRRALRSKTLLTSGKLVLACQLFIHKPFFRLALFFPENHGSICVRAFPRNDNLDSNLFVFCRHNTTGLLSTATPYSAAAVIGFALWCQRKTQ